MRRFERQVAIVTGAGRAIASSADVTDRASLERLAAETATLLGPPDVLVNNAAIAFLASDECGFATGASLTVDGGRSILFHDAP